MSAPQNVWAKPLAAQLVSLFRETNVWFLQSGGSGAYDPLTGSIGTVAPTIWHCGAAVVTKLFGPHAAYNADGFLAGTDVVFWFDSTTLPIEPTTADRIWYQGGPLLVTKVDPLLESDGVFYGYKVTASQPADITYKGSGPPPVAAGSRLVESAQWVYGGNAPGQPGIDGKARGAVLTWTVQPHLTVGGVEPIGPQPVGTVLDADQGTVVGGVAPMVFNHQWFRSPTPPASGGAFVWAPIVGATGSSYTTVAGDKYNTLKCVVTATDSGTPVASSNGSTATVPVGPAALVAATLPTYTGVVAVGSKLTGTAGTATGGTAPITYATHWEISADGLTGWSTLAPDAPGTPLEVTLLPAHQGQHIRLVTIATDGDTPTAQTVTMNGNTSATVAAPADVPLVLTTAPTVAGDLLTGATVTGSGAVATGGVGAITYTWRWQHAAAAAGPWTDIPGATAAAYTVGSAELGQFIRVVATATDTNTPTAHKLDIPGAAGLVKAGLAVKTAPGLPAGAPGAGGTWGPASAAVFENGVAPIGAVTHQWEVATVATGPWTPIAGQTTTTLSVPADATGKFVRMTDSATDAGTPPTTLTSSSAATKVGSAVFECAGGAVWIKRQIPPEKAVQHSLYCTGTSPGSTVWIEQAATYDPATGAIGHGWNSGGTGSSLVVQALSPSTVITYSAPHGDPADWSDLGGGEWVNLRTGVKAHLNAFRAVSSPGAASGYSVGPALNPGTVGYVVAPTPTGLRTTEVAPVPDTSTWTKLAPAVVGGIPIWRHPDGHTVTQYGDPAVIGAVGAGAKVWLGTGPDPWFHVNNYDPGSGAVADYWVSGVTGQRWPATGNARAGQRPQPWDTAAIVIPAGDAGFPSGGSTPIPRTKYWPAAAVPSMDFQLGANYQNATPNPTFDPIVQLQVDAPGAPGSNIHRWWNYAAGRELQGTAKPTASEWVRNNATNNWVRQSDGRVLQGFASDPSTPAAGGAAAWMEFPAGSGHWYSTTGLATAYGLVTAAQPVAGKGGPYLQRWNPGATTNASPPAGTSGLGAETNIATTVPLGVAGDWVHSGTAAGAGSIWTNAKLGQTITGQPQVLNPGVVGALVAAVSRVRSTTAETAPTGNLKPGSTLTAHPGTATGGTAPLVRTMVWQVSPDGTTGWADIAGSGGAAGAGDTYTVKPGDVGKYLRAVETWTDSATPTPDTFTQASPAVGPVLAAVPLTGDTNPTLTGTPATGQKLTAAGGTSHGGTAPTTHQLSIETAPASTGPWTKLANTTAGQWTVPGGHAGEYLRLVDTVTDSSTPTAATLKLYSATLGPLDSFAMATQPTVTGLLNVGSLLSATKGTTSGGKPPIDPMLLPFEPGGPRNAGDPGWQWQSAPAATGPWTNISLANGPTHTITAGEVGLFLRIEATHADSASPTPATAVGYSAAVGPVTAPLPTFFTAPTGDHYSEGSVLDWTATNTTAGRPAGRPSGRRWHNSATGADLWQTDNPGTAAPGVWDATQGGFYAAPAAPGGQYTVAGFVWRAPGGPGAWHFDATHLVWTDGTNYLPQQGSSAVNPGATPTPGDTGPFDLNGVLYAQTSAPPTITWVQTSPGVWQKKINGVNSGPPVRQTPDPRGMPA